MTRATAAARSGACPSGSPRFALCADPRYLLLGLATHLAFFDLATGETQRIVDVEPGLNTRVNDGRCDRQGRFVFGTKDEGSPLQAIGGFYRLNHDLSLERLPLPAPAISNSIAFSPDGATMYYCDSPTREIRVCDYRADGSVANDRVFTTLTDATGEPDGSTVDSDGGLWNAQWGGRRVVRYGPDGVETERVDVPTAQPSCVAFGGPSRGLPSGRCATGHAVHHECAHRSRCRRARGRFSCGRRVHRNTRTTRFAGAGVPRRACYSAE